MGRKRERTRIVSRMDELPEDVRVQAESMLLDRTITYQEIADAITKAGYPISKSSVARYAQRTGRAIQRMQYIRENADAVIAAMKEHRGLELSDVATALMMDNVIQALAEASAEDYSEIPLPKLLDLIMKQQRNAVYKARMTRAYEKDIEEVRRALIGEMSEMVQGDPDAMNLLEGISQKAAQKVVENADG